MRPIEKGNAPNTYTGYGDARHDLAEKIGYYCSYCEMSFKNMIEVEHVIPINRGGDALSWDNFLLSCRYCNGIKSDNNLNRTNYVWPDRNNTDLVFEYSEIDVIKPNIGLNIQIQAIAQNTIFLMGLDRIPGGVTEPTFADTRWRSRQEAWNQAKESLKNWTQVPHPAMSKQIAQTSINSGHYSIWKEVFKDEPTVLDAIDFEYSSKGLFKQFLLNGQREVRNLGII